MGGVRNMLGGNAAESMARRGGVLVAVMAGAWLLRVLLAIYFPNMFRPDEIFQTLEPAHRLVTGWGVVPWEWRVGIRSWVFPGLLAGPMALAEAVLPGRAAYLPLIAALLALGALAPVWAGWRLGGARLGFAGTLACATFAALWPDAVYFGPKTLTEVQAGNLMILALGLAATMPARGGSGRAAAIGALLGLAFDIRFHLAAGYAVVALCAGGRDWRRRWRPMLTTGIALVLLGGLLDWATLGSPFQSIWKNFAVNIGQAKAVTFGAMPWYWYPVGLAHYWGWAAAPFALLMLFGLRAMVWPALAAIAVVASHSVVSHKEFSFIYPALPLAAIIAGAGAARLAGLLRNRSRLAMAVALPVAVAALAWSTGDVPVEMHRGRSMLQAEIMLRGMPGVCGVAAHHTNWFSYAWIDRPLPLLYGRSAAGFAAARHGANVLVLANQDLASANGAKILACHGDLCLLRRDAICQPEPDHTMNMFLIRHNY